MHTLLLHQAFVLPGEPGGTRHYELIQYTRPKGHEFTVVTSNVSYLTGTAITKEAGFITERNVDGIHLLRAATLPVLHRGFIGRAIALLGFMITSLIAGLGVRNVDLVMGTTPAIFQAFSAWLIAAIKRKPFLLEVRDLWPEFAIDMGLLKNPILITLLRWLEKFLYSRATTILVNSPAYKIYLLNKGINAAKIVVIPNGVNTGMFDPDAVGDNISQRYQLEGKFVVTYTGALGAANDIGTVLRAAYLLRDRPDIHFLLVGDGIERRRLEQLAFGLALSNVTFTGSLPKSQIPDVLAASNTCIATLRNIPMFRTTYPNKVFDYMAAGRPTVLAIDGVIREVIEDANGGIFVQPGEETEIVRAILKLVTNPDLCREQGESARRYVTQKFERSEQANKFTQLIQQMACR